MTHPLSLNAFFNALFVEHPHTRVIKGQPDHASFPCEHGELLLPLTYTSAAGRHRYQGDILWRGSDGETVRTTFADAVYRIAQSVPEISGERLDRFASRVSQSDAYVQRAEAHWQHRFADRWPQRFIESEQSLTGGHSMHPAPKSNEPLTPEQQEAYLPEFAESFAIEWFAVAPGQWTGEGVNHDVLDTLQSLFVDSVGLTHTANLSQGWLPLPMHPLQAQAWRDSNDARALKNSVIDLALTSSGWLATSSSRAIYHPDHQWMLKVSLPVKLTNSVRLLTATEAKRGALLSKMLNAAPGQTLQQRAATTTFIEEPVWCTILSAQGEPLSLPLVSLRDNIFAHQADQDVHLLASINQPHGQGSQIGALIAQAAQHHQWTQHDAAHHWLAAFLDHILYPLCLARSDYGILLLAHQQNILLRTAHGLPSAMMYRDCQGIWVTDPAPALFPDAFSEGLPSCYVPTDKVDPYLSYYLIGNTLINTLSAISEATGVTEQRLWQVCRQAFATWRASHPVDSRLYDYLLDSPTLHWKRNFHTFLADHNEATLADPSQIYTDIDNPFYGDNALGSCVFKPVNLDRTVGLRSHSLDASYHLIDVMEHGQAKATFVLHKPDNDTATLTTRYCNDQSLWWAAVEHAFYQHQCQALYASDYPHALQSVVAPCTPLTLSQFKQHCPIWHQAQSPSNEVYQTAENGLTHPTRPEKPQGVFYRRYFYHLKRTLTLRPAETKRDLACFHAWHNHPDIAPIWELEGSLKFHRQYLQKAHHDAHLLPVIGEFDGKPFGYFEIYWVAEDRLGPYYDVDAFDRGMHMLVGNSDFLGRQYFNTWAQSIIHYCFLAEPRTRNVMGEPNATNWRVARIARGVGMKKQKEFDFPHKRAALMQCERNDFFARYAQ
ncbi:hypothetical protein BZG79_08730 [Salinivibrio sp. MA427]|uniref:GNAT family N-acetyltransferase n=1 Tax=Salinivibrio sp. MA427 TaxID=1909455 RepID=UPI00098B5C35|nr:GNAT family N-acetyltransferase [Salinivibrio sp. MA427]OOF12956.1 hypothetical protein BZG79_08730 [Salinivibrio sp. MA427]